MVENTRLNYIRNNQNILRASPCSDLYDAQESGHQEASNIGNRVILPSSFTGGARYLQQNYMDAVVIVRAYGHPDLFITFTCNPKWPEILRFLSEYNLNPEDRPDISTRVFKIRLDSLMRKFRVEKIFGKVVAELYRIEFQKRGLPHAHICLFLDKTDHVPGPDDVDNFITAELPDKNVDPDLYSIVSEFMIHGPCGPNHTHSPCMTQKGQCSKHFPKDFHSETHFDGDSYPRYKRRDDGNFVVKGTTNLDNRYVVPYNKQLLKQYQAHINVEWCNQIGSIKYLFKYINKGPDRITISIQDSNAKKSHARDSNSKDKIATYYSCPYLSACEASWRLFNFDIVHRTPTVYRLQFHLPNHEPIYYDNDEVVENVLLKPSVGTSQFIEWMRCNEIDENARQYTYVEFPRHYVWNKGARKWTRSKDQRTVGRINYVPPKSSETYYLRILLNKVRGPTCYEDIRTVNDVVYDTFKETCYAMGLLDDDREYVVSLNETYQVASGDYCRSLFVSLITTDSLSCADRVWNETRDLLSKDLRHECPTQILDQDEDQIKKVLYNLALAKIEKMLNSSGNSLKNIANMPYPDYEYIDNSCNMMIQDEMSYDMHNLQVEHETLFSTMTDEQKCVYNTILEAVDKNEGGTFFLYGYGGTGKTFVSKTLGAALHSCGDIVINVASSGIAALLLTGGRTAHSCFAIPINAVEDSFCNIQPDSQLAGLLNESKLIIWDEAPMQHRHCVEAFDRTMRDIIRSDNRDKAFGGKVVVFGGDFRQILPVITKGTRSETVHASLHSSELWRECKVLKLTKNMRLLNCVSHSDLMEVKKFAQWILDIGEGKINLPNDGEADVQFPEEVLIRSNYNPIESIVNSLYPSLHQELCNPSYFQERAVLAPTNEEVDAINEFVLSTISDSERVYYSSDTLCPDELDNLFAQQVYSPEILNGLKVPGVPNHKLVLKTGVPIMLLRNIDQSKGLCNGIHLLVVRLFECTIEARIITGHSFGNLAYIPRMIVEPTDKSIAIKFRRCQFPVTVYFAMTINMSQRLKVLILDKEGRPSNTTKNVVYKEVLQSVTCAWIQPLSLTSAKFQQLRDAGSVDYAAP
ncbi:uncharacterized protein [Rutidosis leptorrhynchoides]|uniref:uncharacterized protein n=1 Tax=Rutidosis leptorrhynchoides TaxID=125765 RepID=UPI003A99EB02